MTVEIIIDPDAEAVVIAYLQGLTNALASNDPNYQVEVVSIVPNPRPSKFLQVLRTGGTRANLVVDRPQIILMASADKEDDAIQLLGWARAYINAAERAGVMSTATCGYVNEYSGPANFPEPNSGQYRYRASFEIDLRA